MTFERAMLLVICGLMFLTIIVSLSGCAILRQVTDAIFDIKPEDNVVETSKNQLWQTVKKSNWLVTFSILGIAAGFFAFLNGSKIGLPAIGASCVSLFMTLAVVRFSLWMAIFGMIGSCAAVAISVLVKNKALKEIVCGVQEVKDDKPERYEELREELGKQTKSTKKIVRKIKNKAKLRGEI